MERYVKIATTEVNSPSLAVTRQYLEVNALRVESGRYSVERIEDDDSAVTVFFRIEAEKHFLGIVIEKSDESVSGCFIQNSNRCYLTATSDVLSYSELSRLSTRQPTSGWSRGDRRKDGESSYDFSRVNFEFLESRCYSTENAISRTLDVLEKDRNGVASLIANANAWIAVVKYQYVSANKGLALEIETIRRLASLNLSVDIDMYLAGREILD